MFIHDHDFHSYICLFISNSFFLTEWMGNWLEKDSYINPIRVGASDQQFKFFFDFFLGGGGCHYSRTILQKICEKNSPINLNFLRQYLISLTWSMCILRKSKQVLAINLDYKGVKKSHKSPLQTPFNFIITMQWYGGGGLAVVRFYFDFSTTKKQNPNCSVF